MPSHAIFQGDENVATPFLFQNGAVSRCAPAENASKGSIVLVGGPCMLGAQVNSNLVPMELAFLILGGILYAASIGCTIWLAVISARVAWWWCVLILLTCGTAGLVFAILHWEKSKKPFLIGIATGLLSGVCFLAAGGSAFKEGMKQGMLEADQQAANGETQLPAFDKELTDARKAAEANGAVPAPSKPTAAAQPAPAEEPLPFTPTARPKPFPYKDAPPARTATAAAAPAVGESTGESSTAGQVPVPAEAPPAPPKPKIEIGSATLVREDGSGTIQIEINNAAPKAVTEVKLSVTYLDARGVRVGTWTTTRRGDPRLAPASGSGKFTELAIRMPTAARKVDVQVVGATLEDGTEIEY